MIHIDAHRDLWTGSGLYLVSHRLCVESGYGPSMLEGKRLHSGNYLTFAIVYGWIGSLLWVRLREHVKDLPKRDTDENSGLAQLRKTEGRSATVQYLHEVEERGIPFNVLPWHRFKTSEPFDYVALSRSPDFTPPGSDRLINVIEEYMRQI